jgi:4-amino-4-deoxy-L-arabinose transferase-like glycosyltransferase
VSPLSRREYLGLGGILGIALLVRTFAWSQTAVLFNDGPIFLAMAEAIADGRFSDVLAHPYHPLYPALIAFVAWLSVDLETAGVVVSIFGGLLSIGALFYFVRESFGGPVAWVAAWILALHPWAVDFSSDVMSEGIYTGLFLVAFLWLTRVLANPTLTRGIAMGVACGLAFLVRPEGLGLLPACVVLLAARGFGEPDLRRRATLAGIAALLAAAFVMMPFVSRVSGAAGEITLTQKKSISQLIADPRNPEIRAERTREHARLANLAGRLRLPEQSSRISGPAVKRTERSWLGMLEAVTRVATTSLAAFRWELILLSIVGVWASRSEPRSKKHRDRAISLVLAGYMALLVLLVWGAGYVSRRHALTAWLPMIGYAALGARTLWLASVGRVLEEKTTLSIRLRDSRMVCAAIVLALILAWGVRDLRSRRTDRIPARVAAEWLAINRPDTGAVAAQKVRVAYYAQADFVPLSHGAGGRLAAQLRKRNAHWVIIDRDNLADHLGLEEGIGDWLQLVHTVPFEEGAVLVLSVEPAPAG